LPAITKFDTTQQKQLLAYLTALGTETSAFFGPHAFEQNALALFYRDPKNTAYIATEGDRIVAYAILRQGFLQHDEARLSSYGLELDSETDASFAPSVADDWQGRGLGPELFTYICNDLRNSKVTRLILWGGVQTVNQRAVRYYQQLGFRTLGYFEYHGWNADMVYEMPLKG
jgi:ribosomal protein S18 acetylase RimI-like enzyme